VDVHAARADILDPAPGGAWDIIEAKSTTTVKDVHLSPCCNCLIPRSVMGNHEMPEMRLDS
jgi:hypothetical protein